MLRDTRATPSCPSSSCDPLRIRSPPRRLLGGLGHLAAFARCPSASSSVRSCLFVAVATRLVPCDAEALCGCAWRVHVLTSRKCPAPAVGPGREQRPARGRPGLAGGGGWGP